MLRIKTRYQWEEVRGVLVTKISEVTNRPPQGLREWGLTGRSNK